MDIKSINLLFKSKDLSQVISMAEIIDLAKQRNSDWTNIPDKPGIYIIFLKEKPLFSSMTGKAKCARPKNPKFLQKKWKSLNSRLDTDILYIGKAASLRKRIRALARFGVGKAKNHKGGEWLWQIKNIKNAKLLIQSCHCGKEIGFENWLLEKFKNEHNDLPLANRQGPAGADRWFPRGINYYKSR